MSAVECLTFTAEEAAVVLGISRASVYRRAASNEIPSRKFGRRIVFPQQEILDLVTTPAPKGEAEAWMERSNAGSARMAP